MDRQPSTTRECRRSVYLAGACCLNSRAGEECLALPIASERSAAATVALEMDAAMHYLIVIRHTGRERGRERERQRDACAADGDSDGRVLHTAATK